MGKYATPYFNREDLLKPKSLLILLNARARHEPSVFAHSDYDLAPLFQLRSSVLEELLDTVDLSLQYGSRVHWSTPQAAAESIECGNTVHPIVGCHLLIIQAMIFGFLENCIRGILHDVMDTLVDQLHTHKGQNRNQYKESRTTAHVQSTCKCAQCDESEAEPDCCDEGTLNEVKCIHPPEPPPLSDNDISHGSLEVVVREAPYRLPALLDLGCVQPLAQAWKTEAEDHIWLLREGLGYFAEIVPNAKDHRPETLRGENCGKTHKNGRGNILWARVLESIATEAYVNFSIWHEIHQRMSDLPRLSVRYGDVIAETKSLPQDFFDLLVEWTSSINSKQGFQLPQV
jgi:hypothetical protein